jgi:hypothetical protein
MLVVVHRCEICKAEADEAMVGLRFMDPTTGRIYRVDPCLYHGKELMDLLRQFMDRAEPINAVKVPADPNVPVLPGVVWMFGANSRGNGTADHATRDRETSLCGRAKGFLGPATGERRCSWCVATLKRETAQPEPLPAPTPARVEPEPEPARAEPEPARVEPEPGSLDARIVELLSPTGSRERSAKAIAGYFGVEWEEARNACTRLEEAGTLKRSKSGSYSIVKGAGNGE